MAKTDPRLKLIEFIKPSGASVMVNSFAASLIAAVANGWVEAKEHKAKAAAPKVTKKTAVKKKTASKKG